MAVETLEHALAEAVTRRLTGGHVMALECRLLAYEAAFTLPQIAAIVEALGRALTGGERSAESPRGGRP